MADTEYTKGFRAGVAWRNDEIIKLLEESTITAKHNISPVGNSGWWERGMEYAIALVKKASDGPK